MAVIYTSPQFTIHYRPARRWTHAQHTITFPGGSPIDLDLFSEHDVPPAVLATYLLRPMPACLYHAVHSMRAAWVVQHGIRPTATWGDTRTVWFATTPAAARLALQLADNVRDPVVFEICGLSGTTLAEVPYGLVGLYREMAAALPSHVTLVPYLDDDGDVAYEVDGSRRAFAGYWERAAAGAEADAARNGYLEQSRLFVGTVPPEHVRPV